MPGSQRQNYDKKDKLEDQGDMDKVPSLDKKVVYEFLRLLKSHEVRYILVGGYAVGYPVIRDQRIK